MDLSVDTKARLSFWQLVLMYDFPEIRGCNVVEATSGDSLEMEQKRVVCHALAISCFFVVRNAWQPSI